MTKTPFSGYYGSNDNSSSKYTNNNYYNYNSQNTEDDSVYTSAPSVYVSNTPISTPYTGISTTTPYVTGVTTTPYVSSVTSTPYISSDSTQHHHFHEPTSDLTSHSYILAELKKKKNPFKYTVYRVSIESATIYDAYDSNGLADPYVKVLSVKYEMKNRRRDDDDVKYKPLFKTKVCSKTLEPSWNHQQLIILGNKCRYIDLEVYDKDLLVDDYIGGVRLDIGLPDNIYGFSNYLKLTNEQNKVVGTIMCNIQVENVER